MIPGLSELSASETSSRASSLSYEQLLLQLNKAAAEPKGYVVVLRQASSAERVESDAARLLEEVAPGTTARQVYGQLGGFSADLNDAQARRLRRRPEVQGVERDRHLDLEPPVGEPVIFDDDVVVLPQVLVAYLNGRASSGETIPWGVRAIWQGRDISTAGNVGVGTYAFVIDSGVLATTRDLNLNTAWSRSWIAGQDPYTDGAGHGTHVAGTIGALANGIGVVGVAPGASIVSLKVFDSTGSGSMSNVMAAIDYAVSVITTNKLDLSKVVINLSLGGSYSPVLDAAILQAANLGIRFAVAAGNSGVDADTASPASSGTHNNIYTVSAVDSNYLMPSWSNWDQPSATDPDSVDLAAPGVNVMSYYKSGLLAYLSGTSMAAPHVAGALLMGGVIKGDMVTPFTPGTADPFAWAATFPTSTIPTPPASGTTPAPALNQTLWGTSTGTGNDTIIGGGGNDQIAGVRDPLLAPTDLGRGQADVLTGGAGVDTFVLGDGRGVFYDDGMASNLGSSDYALITDFTRGTDKLQLRNGNYFTTMTNGSTSIYWDANANGKFETLLASRDELIAVVQNSTLAANDIIWV